MSTRGSDFPLEIFEGVSHYVRNREKYSKKIWSERREFLVPYQTEYDTAFKIHSKYHGILKALLANPESNQKEIGQQILKDEQELKAFKSTETTLEDKEYTRFRRMVKDLENVGLIETIPQRKSKIGRFKTKELVPYKLSMAGIFYVILNNHFFGSIDVHGFLLLNYSENPIYLVFLYTCIRKETLFNLPLFVSYAILEYLVDICKLVINHLGLRNWNIFTNAKSLLFFWPDKNNENYYNFNFVGEGSIFNLKQYLYNVLKLQWVADASVSFNYRDDMVVVINKDANMQCQIQILQEQKKVVLYVNGKRYPNLLQIRKVLDYFVITGNNEQSVRETSIEFDTLLEKKLLIFLYDLTRLDDPEVKKILKHDPKFIDSLNDIIKKLEI